MNRLVSDNLWPLVKRLARKSGVKLAAVSYVTTDEFVQFSQDDILVVDATDTAVTAGETKADVLRRAFRKGAEIYSCPGLHAKVLLLGGVAVVGSANMSTTSATAKVEAAWVTDHPATVGMACSFIRQLVKQSQPVNEKFLKRILSLEVKPRKHGFGSRKQRGTRVRVPVHSTWLVGVEELTKEYPDEAEAIAEGMKIAERAKTRKTSEVTWMRWVGNSRFRSEADEGDSVIQVWKVDGRKAPQAVYKHCPILRRQDEPACTRFYIEEGRRLEKTALTWTQFRRLIKRVGVPGRVGPASAKLLREEHADGLFTLWGR